MKYGYPYSILTCCEDCKYDCVIPVDLEKQINVNTSKFINLQDYFIHYDDKKYNIVRCFRKKCFKAWEEYVQDNHFPIRHYENVEKFNCIKDKMEKEKILSKYKDFY